MCKNTPPNRRSDPCERVWVVKARGFPVQRNQNNEPNLVRLTTRRSRWTFQFKLVTKQICSVVIMTHLNIVFRSLLAAARRHEIWIKNGVCQKWHVIPHSSTKSISSIFVCVRSLCSKAFYHHSTTCINRRQSTSHSQEIRSANPLGISHFRCFASTEFDNPHIHSPQMCFGHMTHINQTVSMLCRSRMKLEDGRDKIKNKI